MKIGWLFKIRKSEKRGRNREMKLFLFFFLSGKVGAEEALKNEEEGQEISRVSTKLELRTRRRYVECT